MVASNPLLSGKWTLKKFNATVINDIWPEVFFFSAIAAMVTLVSEKTSHNLSLSTTLLTVLGTVLGLVISFRTSSAYERYQEGRKMWTNIQVASRNLAMMIWIHVPVQRQPKDGQPAQTVLQCTIEKKSMVNLVQAYAVALKHDLRGEHGVYYKDLYPLVCFLPRYADHSPGHHGELLPMWHASEEEPAHNGDGMPSIHHHPADAPHATGYAPARTASLPTGHHHGNDANGSEATETSEKPPNYKRFSSFGRKNGAAKRKFDPEMALPDIQADRPLRPARCPPETTLYDYLPFLRVFKWLFRRGSTLANTVKGQGTRTLLGKKRKPAFADSNVPLEITLFLSSYSNWLMRAGLLQPAIASAMTNTIASMQDTMSNLERIRNTPLPFAYQAHLRISLWLYLFFLPFQIYASFKWLTIPGTAFASFLLLGFLEIGQEIENPFNYDANDLDLDTFCLTVQREVHEITAHTNPDPCDYVFSAWNQPFAPADRRTAENLIQEEHYAPPHGGEFGEDAHYATVSSLKSTLLRSWKDVERYTRD